MCRTKTSKELNVINGHVEFVFIASDDKISLNPLVPSITPLKLNSVES